MYMLEPWLRSAAVERSGHRSTIFEGSLAAGWSRARVRGTTPPTSSSYGRRLESDHTDEIEEICTRRNRFQAILIALV